MIVGVRYGQPNCLVGLHLLVVNRSDGDRRRRRHRASQNYQRRDCCRIIYIARRCLIVIIHHAVAINIRINGQEHDHVIVKHLPVQRPGHCHIGCTSPFAYRGQLRRQRDIHAIRVVVGDHDRSSRQYSTYRNLYIYRPSLSRIGVVRGGDGERSHSLGSTGWYGERRTKGQRVMLIAQRSLRHSIPRRQNRAG